MTEVGRPKTEAKREKTKQDLEALTNAYTGIYLFSADRTGSCQ